VQLVDEAGTAAGLHGDTQAQVVAPLLGEERLDLLRGDVREFDLVGRGVGGRGGRLAHCMSPQVGGRYNRSNRGWSAVVPRPAYASRAQVRARRKARFSSVSRSAGPVS